MARGPKQPQTIRDCKIKGVTHAPSALCPLRRARTACGEKAPCCAVFSFQVRLGSWERVCDRRVSVLIWPGRRLLAHEHRTDSSSDLRTLEGSSQR
jgi:hypothetical protein